MFDSRALPYALRDRFPIAVPLIPAHDLFKMVWWRQLSGTNRLLAVVLALTALLVLADVAFAVRLFSPQFASVTLSDSKEAQTGQHPCNHGFYVSQAAHAKKGGAYVSSVAQSKLGKDGNCTAPLPAH
jgi:hypothetical protein